MTPKVKLVPLQPSDRNQFVLDNQEAFKYGATEEFGMRDAHFEEDGEIISRNTIEQTIDEPNAEAYRIVYNGMAVGGVVIRIDHNTLRGDLDLLFVAPHAHNHRIGYSAWCEVEHIHPEIKVWETMTPYFEKRNIHFYVNRCGFHIVEFFHEHHQDPNFPSDASDEMFRFEKVMK